MIDCQKWVFRGMWAFRSFKMYALEFYWAEKILLGLGVFLGRGAWVFDWLDIVHANLQSMGKQVRSYPLCSPYFGNTLEAVQKL